jgi:hypothetical protein
MRACRSGREPTAAWGRLSFQSAMDITRRRTLSPRLAWSACDPSDRLRYALRRVPNGQERSPLDFLDRGTNVNPMLWASRLV